MPPSIVLEVLRILEGEMNLREETRVAEQARPALSADDFVERAHPLSQSQDALRIRIDDVGVRISKLPDADKNFGKEMALMDAVGNVMREATDLLERPETGPTAIAAETEAIELLLTSKRINPASGGGGGSTPGGGGKGSTNDSAIALMGKGTNDKEVREDRDVSFGAGESGKSLPEEFRSGLDAYFHKWTQSSGG